MLYPVNDMGTLFDMLIQPKQHFFTSCPLTQQLIQMVQFQIEMKCFCGRDPLPKSILL